MNRPKEKMPMYKAVAMVLIALFIDGLKFLFSTLVVTGPLFVGAVAGVAASNSVGSTAGGLVGAATAGSTYLLEFASGGLGALGVAAIGEFFAMIIGFVGWGILVMWLMLSGIPIFDTKDALGLKKTWIIFGTAILDLIPLVNVGAWLTAGIFYIVRIERKKDKERLLKYERSLLVARTRRSARQEAANALQLNQQAQAEGG